MPPNPTKPTPRPTHNPRGRLRRPRWRQISQALWVVFITLVIWVWADLEQTKTEEVAVTIKVVPPSHSDIRVVEPDPEGVRVRLAVRGPLGQINEFRRRLREDDAEGLETACVVQADPTQVPEYSLRTTEVLNEWDRLRQSNLTAESPDLETITVRLDEWTTLAATVRLRTSDDAALVDRDQIVPTPPTVAVRVPKSRVDDVLNDPVIHTEQVLLTGNLPIGVDITRTVPLVPRIGNVPVEFVDTSQVSVTFRIGRLSATRQVQVPVRLQAAPDLWERITTEGYILRRDPNLPHEWRLRLTISGPPKEVERLDPDSVQAFVRITEADLTPTPTYPDRTVTIVLPPDQQGLTLDEPVDPVVHFRFDKPEDAEP